MSNEGAIALLHKWLADDSGYDEMAWPILQKALEEERAELRQLFADARLGRMVERMDIGEELHRDDAETW